MIEIDMNFYKTSIKPRLKWAQWFIMKMKINTWIKTIVDHHDSGLFITEKIRSVTTLLTDFDQINVSEIIW